MGMKSRKTFFSYQTQHNYRLFQHCVQSFSSMSSFDRVWSLLFLNPSKPDILVVDIVVEGGFLMGC